MVGQLTTLTLTLISIHGFKIDESLEKGFASSADFILPHAEGSHHPATDATLIGSFLPS